MASAAGDNIKVKTTVTKPSDRDSPRNVSIDLTDPSDVLEKVISLDLDDDETDDLLKKAYEVNFELKKQLELGRLVMEQRMSSSKERSENTHSATYQRPGSNMISINISPDQMMRQQTRMASATQNAHSRRGNVGLSSLVSKHDHPLKNYSYHSYVSN